MSSKNEKPKQDSKPSTSPRGKPSTSPRGKPSTSPRGKPSTSPRGKPSRESKVETTQNAPADTKEVPGERKYAILQETSGKEVESWYFFIKYNGNEEALAFLEKQLDDVDWYILDELSTFDLETRVLVSEQTAKEMTMVDLNHHSAHRKFDGVLKKIDFKFKSKYDNEKKIEKVNELLEDGGIEDFVDGEDVNPDDLVSRSSSSEESSSEESSESDSEEENNGKKGTLPAVLTQRKEIDVPRFAKAKRHHK